MIKKVNVDDIETNCGVIYNIIDSKKASKIIS